MIHRPIGFLGANQKIDYLSIPIGKIYLKLGIPIGLALLISVFAALINNKLFSVYCKEYFEIAAVLSVIISLIANIPGSIATAGWAKYGASFAAKDENAGPNLVTFFVTLLVGHLCATGVCLALINPLLHVINTPAQIYDDVRLFLIVYLIASILMGLSTMFVTLATGLESSISVLVINACNYIFPSVAVALLVGVFQLGVLGSALYTGAAAFLVICLSLLVMLRHKTLKLPVKKDFRINYRAVFSLLRKSILIFLQALLCTIGYLLVSAQANRYLSLDYLGQLSLTIPVSSGLMIFSTVTSVAIPQNYMAGRMVRTKKILWSSFWGCQAYGIFCFLFHILFARPYLSSLFTDPAVVDLGVEYWFLHSSGYVIVAAIYVIRAFFVAVNRPGIALFAGVFELLGNLICAFILIPMIGNAGRSLAYPLGWLLATIYLLVIYFIYRKRIFAEEKEAMS